MLNQWMVMAVLALVAGGVLYAASNKERNGSGEWSNGLQWGYLLMMVGVFGLLSAVMSFTAVLLIFVLFTGAVWGWHKYHSKWVPEVAEKRHDDNHFRDYMSGFFPIIFVVFVLRTFIVEPFQIPSSSMRPGLVVGDFILVKKSSYGIRVPVLNSVLFPTGQVERGDVVVFNYPEKPDINYIKRAIGLPGDVVEYRNKTLFVNGEKVVDQPDGLYNYQETTPSGLQEMQADQYKESLNGRQYDVLRINGVPAFSPNYVRAGVANGGSCEYSRDGSWFRCTVPEGKYFMMGDNRDASEDSRYWGFVDDRLLVGKAFLIWLNFNDFSRVGTAIK
ncbi:MAG: signal peptidase I [Neisseria sp.]|uniref:signal peptidase I n=1 Tax=Neisseria sp. TaxID=192066 RepID=UPI0026DD5355|nr:signal peptidase I [Neisseria sp.]MDO4640403.1 signal peptidase I [Neisseria sp.]